MGSLGFLFSGLSNLYSWLRDHRPLPGYIHGLGIVGGLTGAWMATLDGGGLRAIVTRAALYIAIMVGLVYISFGYYGARIMKQRQQSSGRSCAP